MNISVLSTILLLIGAVMIIEPLVSKTLYEGPYWENFIFLIFGSIFLLTGFVLIELI